MPPEVPTKPSDQDKDKPKPQESGDNKDHPSGSSSSSSGGSTALRSFGDVANFGLDKAHGGGGNDAGSLSDSLLHIPKSGFNWAVNRTTLEANLAEGKGGVSTKTFTVTDGDGNKRDITGPSSYNSRGQQFIIDLESHQRFRINPPAQEGGEATLTQIGRRGQPSEPLKVVEQKNVEILSFKPGQAPVTREVSTPPTGTGTIGTKPATDGTKPATDSTPPAVSVNKPLNAPAEVPAGPKATDFKPANNNDGGNDGWRNNRGWQNKILTATDDVLKAKGFSEQQIQSIAQVRDSLAKGQSPTREQLQDFQKTIVEARVRQGQDQWKQNNPDQTQFKAQPPVTPDQVKQWQQQQPQQIQDNLRNLNPQQIQALQQYQQWQQQQQQGDRGGRPNPMDMLTRQGLTPDQIQQLVQQQQARLHGPDGKPINVPGMDGKPVNPTDVKPVGPIDLSQQKPVVIDLSKISPVDFTKIDPSKTKLDPQLVSLLNDKTTREQFINFLKDLQQGKMPTDVQLQQNKPLLDIMRAIGPESLADMKKLLTHDAAGGKPGDIKFDANISPKAREIIELLAQQSKTTQLDLQNRPGVLASERLLDILRQNDKLQPTQRIPDAEMTRLNMLELGKILRDMNTQQGQDGKVITMRDLISRSFEDGKDRGALVNLGERRDLVIKPHGSEDLVARTLLDRLTQNRDLQHDHKPGEFVVRTDLLTNRLDTKAEIKIEIKPGEKQDIIVKPTDAKAETAATAQQQTLRQDQRVVDGEKTDAQNKDLQPKGQVADKDKDAKLEEEKQKIKETKKKEDELPVDQAALLAALQAKKRKEQEDKDKQESTQEKDKKEPERRQKYIVRPGDTLEIIAGRMLRDKRLAGLIYEINADTIPSIMLDGKKVPQIREKMVIWLPTPTEAREYRTRLMAGGAGPTDTKYASAEDELEARFGKNWSGTTAGAAAGTAGGALEDMEDAARQAYAARRKHIESLLGPLSARPEGAKVKYVVRLGEQLKSVAMKHPSLQDVNLWKLLAELNGLSIKTDEKGTPLAKLTRGQALIIPSAAEIEAFRQRESSTGSPREKITGAIELPTRSCPSCKRTTFASAVLCPKCGHQFGDKADATAVSGTPTQTRVSSGTSTVRAKAAPEPSTRLIDTQSEPSPAPLEFTIAKQFSTSSRLMSAGTIAELTAGYKLRLDVLENDNWTPVVLYEVFAGVCLRHEIAASGQRKTIRIDLPPQAASELAQNDLESNWQSYESAFRSAATG